MLESTFIHIQGIGRKTECRLWKRGIHTWRDFLNQEQTVFSPARDSFIRHELEASLRHRGEISFFSSRLSSGEIWRLFEAFKDKAVYLDIETNADYQGVNEITVIGLYDGHAVQTFINGFNLDEFEAAVARYNLVITFGGATFDLPLIRAWFPGISLPVAHIDLRYLLKRLGYTGGLKKIEKDFGIIREPDIDGLDGYEAVRLWRAYQWGDDNALDRLIRYNTADIVNLKPLMEMGYEGMKTWL